MGKHHVSPAYNVLQVPIEKIQANSYNPNKISPPEMRLLIKSILEDGYTMPIVCYYLADTDRYEIVDGFHRYLAMKMCPEIAAREKNTLPVAVIDKPTSERMASTIRHNRARGTHVIDLMVDMVAQLTEAGLSDDWIMKNTGMDADELLRLKQISGLAALFADREFSRSWKSDASALPPEHMRFEDGEEVDTTMAGNFF
ncbi:MAG: ParB/RepB/Spo0J family partition protein [Clostridium sp.]|jgi:ParB-like chromosome segregation protein Spo0J|nr:ParB/RepB/Spo0J family partition protein [Clostridium sp.]